MTVASLDALRDLARTRGITLPPLTPTPKRWMRALRSPQGPAVPLPTDPRRIMAALAWNQRLVLACAIIGCLVGSFASALVPWALGEAVDTAMTTGIGPAFWLAVLVFIAMVGLVALGDGLGELFNNGIWLGTEYTARRTLTFRIAERSRAMKRKASSGDVLTATMDDTVAIGQFFESFTNAVAAMLVIVLVAYLMLSVSVPLGLTVMIGLPITLGLIAMVGGPLERRQGKVRDAMGELTTITTDAVQGLRILRGVGGEAAYAKAYAHQSAVVRTAAIEAARASAILDAVQMGGPLLLVSIVVAQGAMLAFDGAITPGQLVAFYGYTFYLRMPLWIATHLVENYARAKVGTARIADVLAIEPAMQDDGREAPAIDWASATLSVRPAASGGKATAGVAFLPRRITGVLAASPEIGAAMAKALGCAESRAGLWVNDHSADNIPLADLRAGIVLSEASPQVFAGTLRDGLLGIQAPTPEPGGAIAAIYAHVIDAVLARRDEVTDVSEHPEDHRLLRVVELAHAEDVVEALPGGLDGVVDEKGRNLSGGQRQRLVLARAYATDAPVLVLVEPTSALDAHTESLIGASLPEARGGRTTVVVTQSPLVLAHCDEVVVIDDNGEALVRGSYAELRTGDGRVHLARMLGERGDDA